MGSLFRRLSGQRAPTEPPEGIEHRKWFPLVCRTGDAGNLCLKSGMPGRAQREYLKVFYYLLSRRLIDQFLLAKAYLGLMAVESVNAEGGQLRELVDGDPQSWVGPMEIVGAFYGPAHHCFKTTMLSSQDHSLYHALSDFARGRLPEAPEPHMSDWDLRLATQPRFPVLHMASQVVVAGLEGNDPPKMLPEMEDLELHIPALEAL